MIPWLLATASAEPYRGDHHHAGQRWATIETRFFRVHYPTADGAHAHDARATAEEVAAIADGLLLRLSAHAGVVPQRPVHVVVSDEADGMNAWTMPGWGLVVLSTDPGGEVPRLRARVDWVPDALAHELGHLVAGRRSSALAGNGSYGLELQGTAEVEGFGGSLVLPFAPNEPYGWSEGAAEAWSEAVGVNRWDARREARIRGSAVEGRLLEWDEWLVAVDKGDVLDAERAYQQGYAFARWLSARFGEDVFVRMAELSSQRYPLDWGRLLERATGEEPRALWAAWRAEAQVRGVAWEAEARAAGATEGREIESWVGGWDPRASRSARDRFDVRGRRDREEAREVTGAFDLWPRTSPDGRWYAEEKVGWLRVARLDADDLPDLATEGAPSPPSAWIPASRASGYTFVPGRDAVVVTADEDLLRPGWLPHRADPWTSLWVVDLGTTEARDGTVTLHPTNARERRRSVHLVPGTLRAREPSVSPDGATLAFLVHRDRQTDLVTSGLDGSDRRVIRTFDDGTWVQGPSFSPDGRSLVVSLFREQGDLWTVDLGDERWTRLTDDARDELDPVWREDGVWAAVEGEASWDVVRLDPATGVRTRATRVLGTADTPWITPSGDLLYAEGTAFGTKAMVLPREDLLLTPDPPVDLGEKRPDLVREPVAEPRPYAAHRALLVPAIGPLIRVDVTPEAVVPAAGGWVRGSDAAEEVELAAFGLLGTTSVGDVVVSWRGLPPELSVEAMGAVSPTLGQSVGTLSFAAAMRWNDAARVTLRPMRVASRGGLPDTTGERLVTELELGHLPDGEPGWTGGSALLAGTVAQSRSEDLGVGWWRLELGVDAGLPLHVRSGPLAEHVHTLRLGLEAGATSTDVPTAEELVAGGDLPGALRALSLETSAPMPGYPPFGLRGEHRVVGSVSWEVPLAPRLRTTLGPLHLRALALAVGGDAGNAWDVELHPTTGAPLLGDATLELRWWATLFDARWDGGARLAVPVESDPVPRVSLSLGAGVR